MGAQWKGWGLSAVLASPGPAAGHGVRAGSSQQRLARVLLCLPGMSSKPQPVTGNFQPER